jgi:hypothetical protein
MVDNTFAEEVLEGNMEDPLEILNWYRNLYYKEPSNTEQGIMANAINDLFMRYRKEFGY